MPSCCTRTTCVPVTGRIRSRAVSSAIVASRAPHPPARERIIRGDGRPRDVCGPHGPVASWARVRGRPERRCDAGRRPTMTARSKNHDWLAQAVESALEPDLAICDPHHHLWDQVTGRTASRYLIDEIVEDVSASHNIVSTGFIECGAMFKSDGPGALRPVGETEFVNGIAAISASGLYGKTRIAAGIVGTANLRLGDGVASVLDAQIAAGGGRFRGIRLGAAWDPNASVPSHRTKPGQSLLLRDDFRKGFAHLAPRKLTFEAWLYHHQIPDVTSLARAFPGTTIILNHFGGALGIGPHAGPEKDIYAEWRKAISELATCPNVVAKLGGINMEINGFGWHERSRPPGSQGPGHPPRHTKDFTIEKFGADRCMFESNFPVDKASCSYTVLWNSFKRLTKDSSAAERAKLFPDTHARPSR